MGRTYHFSHKAKTDLADIWEYSEEHWGITQADQYYREIFATVNLLSLGELRGRICTVSGGYLKYAVGRHFIYFREENEQIEVVRILHQRMDVERQFHGLN